MSKHSEISNSDSRSTGMIEVLLFSLGNGEVFGINVFKIREVTEISELTSVPGQPGAMKGVISLRGQVLPVIDLAMSINMSNQKPITKLIIAEFASRSVAFAVADVDKIIRVPWSDVKPPQRYESDKGGSMFGVVLLEHGGLVSLLDIESICQNILPHTDTTPQLDFNIKDAGPVFFVDDSLVARKQISSLLDSMGLKHAHAVNGVEAQKKLLALADAPGSSVSSDIREKVSLLLVDEEMPEMDGCTLIGKLKADPRFKKVPIVMYSSLTSEENARRGLEAGVNMYVRKFDSATLSKAIGHLLEKELSE